MANAYVYAPVSKKYGTGHWMRAVKHCSGGDTAISLKDAWKIRGHYGIVYVDVKNSSFMVALWLRGHAGSLVFIDDYGLGARTFGDECQSHIPHWKESNKKYKFKPPKPMSVYIYTGGLDPHGVALKILKSHVDGPFEFYIAVGNKFTEKYRQRLIKYCVDNDLEFVLIDDKHLHTTYLGAFDLIYMTWGLHYLSKCHDYNIIPVAFDNHTRKLIRYWSGHV